MQDLTAHYNILFNANEILRKKQDAYATAFVDNYNELLAVYQDTTPQTKTVDKDLDQATVKANYLINMKEQSKYIGDAYLVLGKANYLEGNYYNAVEYFNYVIRSFPKRKDLVQQSYCWKTRTLIYLDRLSDAKSAIDTAIANINPKKHIDANIYATKLAYDIAVMDYTDGEEMAKNAVKYCHDGSTRLRWTFILSQLEELNHEQAAALANYEKIAKSNALFEMAFNASLNVIRIRDMANGVKVNRVNLLMALMKNPNNADFKDQIYYNIGLIKQADKDLDGAIKYYNLSLRVNTKNQTQKGMSYLRLAEIYFDPKADYIKSKKYYDSTLANLPVTYPGYVTIQKKGVNMAYLSERLLTIAKEDTLQALARMDPKKRDSVIDKMVADYILQQQALADAAKAAATVSSSAGASTFAGGSFYFDNAGAVSQGYNDFKKQWGNRKLEDNWRRSTRTSSNITANTSGNTQSIDPDAPFGANSSKSSSGASAYRQNIVKSLPVTPELLTQSNQRIYNAVFDLANFYRDVMQDNPESIIYFEKMLTRFPDDQNRPAVYYALYRLYTDIDPAKSEYYKQKLLKEYPETPFAKVISDPEYFKKLEDKDAELTAAYNTVFDLYDHKQYKDMLACITALMKQYPGNKYASQIYYLQTIAQGHFEPVEPFRDSLQQLIAHFPQDKLVNPLAKQHLTFINANMALLTARPVVLADVDPKEVPFTLAEENRKKTPYRHPPRAPLPYEQAIAEKKKELKEAADLQKKQMDAAAKPDIPKPQQPAAQEPVKAPPQPTPSSPAATNSQTPQVAATAPPGGQQPTTQAEATPAQQQLQTATTNAPQAVADSSGQAALRSKVISSIFSLSDSTNYYFVVNVATATTNLASSRFGIGQFNRANYTGSQLRHQLLPVGDNNQLIYVGMFSSLGDVKQYARQIVPLLPDIMKVPAGQYSYFIITKDNLSKITDKATLDSYIQFYQSVY